MKKIIKKFVLLILFTSSLFSQSTGVKLEKTTSFYPQNQALNDEDIDWYYLSVPENWDKINDKKIKIAVAVLKSKTKNNNSNPLLYIEGGPGGGGIEGISNWLNDPLREKSDVVLVDVRGTGNSLPKFCPDLGKKFLEILAQNQNASEDEKQKTIAAMACKQDLIARDIDFTAYKSKFIAKDLHELKRLLKYSNWNIYGVSYGTYMAQVYANDFSQDIKSIALDSAIPNIANDYYNTTTSKFMNSLESVFNECKNNPNCNNQYPNLENIFYQTIDKLSKNPITVKVDKKIIPSGTFTFNVEDFKVCIQQSLYKKKLIEVIPLLITQFHKGEKGVLASLVSAFAGNLNLDYGSFYCVTCNEALPFNSIEKFKKDASKYKKLKGGLSFYESDFKVCEKWNQANSNDKKEINDLSNLSSLKIPVMIFSGKYDPVTPPAYGKMLVQKFNKAYLVHAPISGHVPSFSMLGSKILNEFVQNPNQLPDIKELETDNKIHFVKNIQINKGIAKFGKSMNEFNLLFFAPLFIAIIVLLIAIFSFSYRLITAKKGVLGNKLFDSLIIFTSVLGLFIIIRLVLALNNTAQDNFYILAFGLPHQYSYLFILQWVFIALTIATLIYFLARIKFISEASVIATILFSLILFGIYFQYWGFLF